MDFLKAILGDELYSRFEAKINEYNGNEANKDNPVKIGNLGSGEYVSKGKFDALQASLTGKETELGKANQLIEDMKKAAKDDETMSQKIKDYETQVQTLQGQLLEEQLNNAIKLGLLEAEAEDVDYLTYKLKEKYTDIKLGKDGKVDGWEEKLSSLKTQLPNQFKSAAQKKTQPNRLPGDPDPKDNEPKDLADALRMSYEKKI